MKAASVKEIKAELSTRTEKELIEICLKLSKFKKENKELLTYLLYDAQEEITFIENVKLHIDDQFENVNTKSYYFMKKSVRKILKEVKKYIRYSKNKETEVELLLYFCHKMTKLQPSINQVFVLKNIYLREKAAVGKKIAALHEDLQYDYGMELEDLQ